MQIQRTTASLAWGSDNANIQLAKQALQRFVHSACGYLLRAALQQEYLFGPAGVLVSPL